MDWQSGLTQIKERGDYLLRSQKWTDCRFLVGKSPNQRLIAAHTQILAMGSPVFEAMFFGSLPEQTDPIIISDIQPDVFDAILEYIYTDHVKIISDNMAIRFAYGAKKYMLPHVLTNCGDFLIKELNSKNVLRIYEFAKWFEEPDLMQSAMEFIQDNTYDVLNHPSCLNIKADTLMDVLDQDLLAVSELELFNFLLKLAIKQGILDENSNDEVFSTTSAEHRDNVSPTDSAVSPSGSSNANISVAAVNDHEMNVDCDAYDEMNADTIHKIDAIILQEAVKKIRFLSMTPKEFAEGPARSKLLTPVDSLAILIMLNSPTLDDSNLPVGFSVSRDSRKFCRFYYD
ncbi:hypothetical protein ACLKA7_014805 [Drosophila subpalustris]